MGKLPKLLIHAKNDVLHNTAYLVKAVDKEEKEKHIFTGEDGINHVLYIPTESINNQISAYPTTAEVVESFGEDPTFKAGDIVIVEQNVMRTPERGFREWNVFYEDEEHGELYRSFGIDTFVRINPDKSLTPRKGILICETTYRDNYSTTLDIELPDSAKTKRRDLVRVTTVWDGCDEYKTGDYLLIERSADWRFSLDGKEHIKVDTFFNDVIAVVDSESWANPRIDNTLY